MKKLVWLILFLPVFLNAQNFQSQELENTESNALKFGIVPQYVISNGLRFDFDYKLNDRGQWLVVAPQFYVSKRPNLDWNYKNMTGAGIEIQHKIFLGNDRSSIASYFAYGPVFNYFSVTDNGLVSRSFVDNGGNFIDLVDEDFNTRIFKLGGNIIMGIQYLVGDYMYIDPYVGVGIRFSYDNQTEGLHEGYNEWWGDMGYSGTLMVGGIRIGILF